MRSQSRVEVAMGFSHRMCLPALAAAQGELGVHAVGQDDVDDLDGRVLRELVEGGVVVEAGVGNAILRSHFASFVAVSADQRDGLAVFALAHGRQDLPKREAAEADHRKAGALGLVFKGAGNLLRLLGGRVVLGELDVILLVGLAL